MLLSNIKAFTFDIDGLKNVTSVLCFYNKKSVEKILKIMLTIIFYLDILKGLVKSGCFFIDLALNNCSLLLVQLLIKYGENFKYENIYGKSTKCGKTMVCC